MPAPHPADKKMRPREGKDWPMVTQQRLVPRLLSLGQLHQAMKKRRRYSQTLGQSYGKTPVLRVGTYLCREEQERGPGHTGQVDERDVRDTGPQVSADRLWAPGNIL